MTETLTLSGYVKEKEPWLAFILSNVVPGLGQYHAALKSRGVIFFCAVSIPLLYGIWLVISCTGDTMLGYTTDSTCLWALEGHLSVIPAGSVFVLGDNNETSGDSRYFGPIEESKILGVTCKILWPLSRVRKL